MVTLFSALVGTSWISPLWRSPNRNTLAALPLRLKIWGPEIIPGDALPQTPGGGVTKASVLKYWLGRSGTGASPTPVYSGRELRLFDPVEIHAFPAQEGVSGFPLAIVMLV